MPKVRKFKTFDDKKVRRNMTIRLRKFVRHLDEDTRNEVLAWTEKAQAIYQTRNLTPVERLKAFYALPNREVAQSVLKNHEWAQRIPLSQRHWDVATVGADATLSLFLMTPVGGAVLNTAIMELVRSKLGETNELDEETHDDASNVG